MPFLHSNPFISIGIIASVLVITLYSITQLFELTSLLPRTLLLILVCTLALALLIWWRRKITQSYVEKLRVSEVEALYKEISDKEHEIEKLHSNNRYPVGIFGIVFRNKGFDAGGIKDSHVRF